MKKGEFSDCEPLVEQSDTKNGITISLWMTYNAFREQNVKYEVDLHDVKNISERYHGYKKLFKASSATEARTYYEQHCSQKGFNPYP